MGQGWLDHHFALREERVLLEHLGSLPVVLRDRGPCCCLADGDGLDIQRADHFWLSADKQLRSGARDEQMYI